MSQPPPAPGGSAAPFVDSPARFAAEKDPIALFARLFAEAQRSEPHDATAVALATADASARPAVRMVLLKGVEADGFVFFTNYGSRKAQDLEQNPQAALCFHWPNLGVQVRVEGAVRRESASGSDAYFQSRPRGSQLSAWASQQSTAMAGRETLLQCYAAVCERFGEGPVPRPDFWGGYRLSPQRIEFWASQPYRLHDRLLYLRSDGGWQTTRLFP